MRTCRPMFVDLEKYWWKMHDACDRASVALKREKQRVPTRQFFNPMSIPALLPYISLLEYRGRYDLQVRLSGTALDRALPSHPPEGNIFNYVERRMWEFYADMHENVRSFPCGVYYERIVETSDGRSFMLARNCLPIADNEGYVKFIIGVVFADTEHLVPFRPGVQCVSARMTRYEYIDLGYGIPAAASMTAMAS